MPLSITPAAWWGLHEPNAGDNRADATGNGKTLADGASAVGSAVGFLGLAASFGNGVARGLDIGEELVSAAPFSLVAFGKPSAGGVDQPLICQGINSPPLVEHNRATLYLKANGTVGFAVDFDGGQEISGGAWADGSWVHAAGTFDGTTAKLYVNGVLVATGTPTATFGGTSPDFFVGQFHSPLTTFTGLIELAGVFAGVLSADDVTLLYGGGGGFDYPFATGGLVCGDLTLTARVSGTLTITASVTGTLTITPRVTGTLAVREC